MNANLFDEMLSGFVEAKKHRAGRRTKLRVSRLAFQPVEMKPAQIRGVRNRLKLSQPEFAEFLCTSIGTVRSWEQGSRSPHSSALRLLAIAKEKPALLLRMAEAPQRQLKGKRKPRLVISRNTAAK
jgi:putative transcriptional regulator